MLVLPDDDVDGIGGAVRGAGRAVVYATGRQQVNDVWIAGKPKLRDRMLVDMMTVNAARAMCLADAGEVSEGKTADLLLIDGNSTNPWASLTHADYADIMLVIADGVPRYGDIAFAPVFDAMKIPYETLLVKGARKILAGNALELQNRVRRAVKFRKELDFLPIEAA